jgi:hypothetical protein
MRIGTLALVARGSPPRRQQLSHHSGGGQSSAIACPAVLSPLKGWLWLLPGRLGSRACSAPLTSPRPGSSETYTSKAVQLKETRSSRTSIRNRRRRAPRAFIG